MTRSPGFTLIELSIVLVIIGLIVGGIVVGKDLVEVSKIRAQVSQFEQLTIAVRNFKNKYNCIPGDCSNATTFIVFPANTGVPGTGNGDGNGYLEQPIGQLYPYHLAWEANAVMSSLNLTGLYPEAPLWDSTKVPVIGKDLLKAKLDNSSLVLVSLLKKNGYYLGLHADEGSLVAANNIVHFSTHGIITPLQAFNIDSKMDDGIAMTGKIYSVYTSTGDSWTHLDNGTTGCISGTAYNLANKQPDCRLFIEGGW